MTRYAASVCFGWCVAVTLGCDPLPAMYADYAVGGRNGGGSSAQSAGANAGYGSHAIGVVGGSGAKTSAAPITAGVGGQLGATARGGAVNSSAGSPTGTGTPTSHPTSGGATANATSTDTSTGVLVTAGTSASSSGGTRALTPNGGSSANSPVTGGTPAIGGNPTTGGVTATGGSPSTGGVATGGVTVTGGSPTTGGVTATGGSVASGCTGGFETVQTSGKGLCVAKMATVSGSGTVSSYRIDVTEVTRGQYGAWLKTNPGLPAKTDPICGWNTDYAALKRNCMEDPTAVCQTNCDLHPQVCVDWCDAYAYCAAVGKHLCGKIGGTALNFEKDEYADVQAAEWYRACTSGGAYDYPYGDSYNPATCNSNDLQGTTTEVGSMTRCYTKNANVFDLSGNVSEWENSCGATGSEGSDMDQCATRGGNFSSDGMYLDCTGLWYDRRFAQHWDLGFRCCAP